MSTRETIVLVRGHIGELIVDSEAEPKTTGLHAYATDLHVEGMLWGATVRSPHRHARIRGIDVAAALATEGVHAVLTSADVPGRHVYGIEVADQPILASDVVRYVGEPVAIVAAVDLATAQLAGGLVAVDYEVLEPVTDAAAADVLHAARIRYGDPVTGADVVVSGTLRGRHAGPGHPRAAVGTGDSGRGRRYRSACRDAAPRHGARPGVRGAVAGSGARARASGRVGRHVRRP